MKLTVPQESLAKALNIVSRVASSRTTLPILNNILLRAENGQLQLTATNLEIFIINSINCQIKTDGVVTVPANLLTEFITNLPKTNITIENIENKLKISAGNYKSVINTTPNDDFPNIPNGKTKTKLEIDSKTMKSAVAQVAITASNDTTRPVLTGVYLHIFEGGLYMTATDGYRLAERQIISHDGEINTIIPTTTVSEVVRVISDDIKNIKLEISDEQVSFSVGSVNIISRLIDGKYINYRQLIPSKSENRVTLDKSEFIQAVKIAELFARESAESIILKTNSANQTLSVSSIANEIGENNSEIEAKIKGDGAITLNAKYLLAALNVIDGDEVKFDFSGKLAPSLVMGKNENYKHIIMPVKS
ncbi:MAG: DNA polymerase III subunit beta [Candidatus Nomurabacteria bacterium]|jgi:DNA polymerase-3 subunit beta|nr:DNA polymerase III subunit beta [Candidatus Nomurabacteria bacterium]